MHNTNNGLYVFGSFCLDAISHKLTRDGVEVGLAPKACDVLSALVKRAGKVVEKDTLLEEVWPDLTVEEGNLTVHISAVRKVLGDSTNDQHYIETIPNRGYRFAIEVKKVSGTAEGQAPSTHQPEHHTKNFRASQYYLSARQSIDSRTEMGLTQGKLFFQKAVEADPHYTHAWAGLCDAWLLLGNYNVEPAVKAYQQAEAAALKALALSDQVAEVHAAYAGVSMIYRRDFQQAELSLKRAIELSPQFEAAYHRLGMLLSFVGRFEDAMAAMKQAQQCAPLSKIINADIGWLLYLMGRFDEAAKQLQETIEIARDFSKAYFYLSRTYLMKGMFAEAIAVVKEAQLLDKNPWTLAQVAYTYAATGKREEAVEILKKLRQIAKKRHIAPYFFAEVHIGLGDLDKALNYLKQSYEQHNVQLCWMKVEPIFDTLRDDPRFNELLKQVGFLSI